jgi:chromosome segregation ATPase
MANIHNIGSISIESGLFLDTYSTEAKQIWVTLFDHQDDDLYDGDFTYPDSEPPRVLLEYGDVASRVVKTSHRVTASAAKTVEKKAPVVTQTVTQSVIRTTKTTSSITKYSQSSSHTPYQPVAEFEIGHEVENSNGFDVRHLEDELKSELQTTVQDLNDDQSNRHGVDNERVGAMGFLEKTHQELKGEHAQDLDDGRRLTQTADDIDRDITQHKSDINAQISGLKDQHKTVDGDTKVTKTEITKRTTENKGLQDTIDIPEDLNEKGFSKEAKTIRKENTTLYKKVDTETDALVKESHERDSLLNQHSEEVGKYNDTVYNYHNSLLKAEQARKITQDSLNKVQEQVDNFDTKNTHLEQRAQIAEIDLDVLGQQANTLRRDHESSNKIYNEHINELSDLLAHQDREINILKDGFNNVGSQIKHLNSEVDQQKVAITSYEKDMDSIKAIGYDDKIGKLHSDLKKADEIRQKHQDELENINEQWTTKMEVFRGHESERQREKDQRLADIAGNLDKLQSIQGTINELLRDLDSMSSKTVSDDNKDSVQGALNNEFENTTLKLRWANEEKDNTLRDLNDAIRLAREKDDEVREQEKRIQDLLREIDELRRLLEEKKRIIEQLERDIQLAIEEIERLKKVIEELDRRIELLRDQIRQRDFEIAQLQRELAEKDARAQQLLDALNDAPAPVLNYKAIRGDEVDEMLAKYLIDCPVPVKRLGGGFYLFGTRKIYAKIMNGKLVVRVGGGYMMISEFITSYSEHEIIKLTKICEQYGIDSIWDLDLEELYHSKSPGNRNSPGRSPKGGDASPNFNKSKKEKTMGKSINGSNRGKAFNASALVRKVE